ncbi:cobalt/nickel transport system permease protein [Maridesulfovibrio ferrireducens]|uniref:Cobalt/nickel transport system permease protein n=1 Tax=Maridesulfovibrio ferrireducens TaxID=246191 RepID=A0A1G9G338_9BACT|nr:cobalt transporter CbiM [Maridesulfovibrio ferrireducens]SDK94997.1 cobalt/nickel transport system permease protein [Maridesulfovibrio ferrireducens]
MHISEGVLSLPVLAVGITVTAIGTTIGLKKLDSENLITVALLSSVFFVASLIHIPLGPSSAHLILSGLMGLILGWAAFPAIFTGLLLQAILFQYGGLTVIGVNTATMALPAVLCHYLFRSLLSKGGKSMSIAAFMCGALSIALSAILTAFALSFTDDSFIGVAQLIVYSHIPIMIIEGFICLFTYSFLYKVRPEMLVVTQESA